MSYLSELNVGNISPVMTAEFKGLNLNLRGGDGEMTDMINLSAREYPVLAPRVPRGHIETLTGACGMTGKQQLAWCAKDPDGVMRLFWANQRVPDIELSNTAPKQIVSMGAYLCVWPDKVYYNTMDPQDKGSMEAHVTVPENGTVTVTMCRQDGTDYDADAISVSNTPIQNPTAGQLWMDTGSEPHTLKQWSASSEEWVQVPTTFVKLQSSFSSGWAKVFKEYDVIDTSGIVNAYFGQSTAISEQLQALEGSMIVYQCGDNYIVLTGVIDQAVTLRSGSGNRIKFDRNVPDCDYITEANNRLWGCKYGLVDGETVNELYACKLGDFKNWGSFMGLTTDAYRVSVGTDGPFTGAISLRGYPIFFKDNCIHKISGDRPSNFTMTTTMCRGVEQGSERSLAIVNEQIVYKATGDIMVYDGSMPVSIGAAFNGKRFRNAAGGSVNGKYYISMADESGSYALYVYDFSRGMWHKEDNERFLYFADVGDEIYAIHSSGRLYAMQGDLVGILESSKEKEVPWQATFAV